MSEFISPDLTVRQVATRWPGCAALLEAHPQARHNERWTLQEIAPFARTIGMDERRLLHDLSAAANAPIAPRAARRRGNSPTPLIMTALITGIALGAGWGVGLLLRIAAAADYDAAPGRSVHIHGLAQLWGWMAMFIFAIAARLLRQNTKRPAPAWLGHLAAGAILGALLLFFAGLSETVNATMPRIDIIASSLLLLAAGCFSVSVIRSLTGRGQKPLVWHGFVILTIAWLDIWAGADLLLRVSHADQPIIPDTARALLIALPVLGFATNAIFGFGIRLIPGLLNIGRLRPRCFVATMVMYNAGLVLLLTPLQAMRFAGSTLMLLAAGVYLIGMNLLRGKPSRPIHGVDARGHILIRAAFFWLICGLALIWGEGFFTTVPHAYSGAWRHALTVGFITTMMLGVGHRIIPVFIKQPLASMGLMRVCAVLILIGNAGRVSLELATLGEHPWTYRAMGMTGLLELSALTLFVFNLALTIRNKRRIYAPGDPLTADTRVREVVNARPELQARLDEMGVTMFDNAPFIAPSMTLGALALASGKKPEHLLTGLEGPGR